MCTSLRSEECPGPFQIFHILSFQLVRGLWPRAYTCGACSVQIEHTGVQYTYGARESVKASNTTVSEYKACEIIMGGVC